jgi:hypothetical protein
MPINTDKAHLWKADTRASVDQFNQWFMTYAPKAFRDTRSKTVEHVEQGLLMTKDLTIITPEVNKTVTGDSADATHGHLPTTRSGSAYWPR